MLVMVLKEGPAPVTLKLEQDVVTIGRAAGNTIKLKNVKASRMHARIERVGATYQITDLGSGNGTRVNGEKVEFGAIDVGDEIRIGDALLTLQAIETAVDADEGPADEVKLEFKDEAQIDGDTEFEIKPPPQVD